MLFAGAEELRCVGDCCVFLACGERRGKRGEAFGLGTMMVDLASFGEEKFNAKGWVNAACKARHPDDSMEKYLGDLEMKLQLMAESIAGSLEEQSAQALLRVPRASRDVLRIRDDAISLRSTVSAVLSKLNQVPLSLSLSRSLSLLWYLSSFFLICVIRPLLLFICLLLVLFCACLEV